MNSDGLVQSGGARRFPNATSPGGGERVARYRYAQLSAVRLAGDINATNYDNVTLDELLVTLKSELANAYLQNGVRWYIGLEEFSRGRLNETRNWARELMKEGQSLDDPRSTGLGFLLLSMIAVVSGSNTEALEYSEQSLSVAITPSDRFLQFGFSLDGVLACEARLDHSLH
jgi:hypothetical protein